MEGAAAGREQFVDTGRANVKRPSRTKTNVVIDLAVQSELPGLDQTARGIVGHAACHGGIQRLHKIVLEQWRVQLKEAFLDVIRTGKGRGIAVAVASRGGNRGCREMTGFPAIFATERDRDIARWQAPG